MTLPTYNIERIELELTNTCNLDCPLCMRSITNVKKIKPQHRELQDIINQLDSYKDLKYITLAGPTSEPTLYPHLFELLKYCNSRKLEISLFINGDTHNELYYKKLGVIFRSAIGHVYFTICGSTQELHSKYRVGSKLDRVLKHLDIVKKYSNKAILTWIIFNYNYDDYKENIKKFKDIYEVEAFNTLPIQEHFEVQSDIHLIEPLHSHYINNIDRDEKEYICPAINYKFGLIDYTGEIYPCSLYKNFKEEHCFECSKNNIDMLRKHKIYNVAEPESEFSEISLRL